MRTGWGLRAVVLCGLLCACDGDRATAGQSSDAGADAGGKRREIELVRDALGITHVYAPDDEAALYGQGYAVARDRLFQMELMRRQALGTRAELVGEQVFEDDVAARVIGFARLGERDAERVQKEHPALFRLGEAWVRGANARIDEMKSGAVPAPYGFGADELDFVPEPWTTQQMFAVGKMLSFGMSSSLEYELLSSAVRNLAPQFAELVPLSLSSTDAYTMVDYGGAPAPDAKRAPPASRRRSPRALPKSLQYDFRFYFGRPQSNNWAVTGALTDTGRPYLAGDPHQPLDSPTRFWPVHLHSKSEGGTLDVVGFAFAGTPGVQLGHNDRIAWTATTNFADVMDLFELELGDASEVSLGGKRYAVQKRVETIRVRAASGELESRKVEVRDVDGVGVILPDEMLPVPTDLLVDDDRSDALLMKWTGFEASREFAAYAAIDQATSIDAFEKAAELLDVGAVNFVAADAKDVLYRVHARIPDRGAPSAHPMPWHVVPAELVGVFWNGTTLGEARLPRVKNPALGYVGTANNDPWGFTADGNVENDPFYYGGFFDKGFRAHRIRTRLSELAARDAKITRDDVETLQRDVHSTMADFLLPRLAEAVGKIGSDDALNAYVDDDEMAAMAATLAAWDRKFTRDSGEAVVFLAFEWFAARSAFAGSLTGLLFDPIAEADPPYLLGALRNTVDLRFERAAELMPSGRDKFLLDALRAALDWVKGRFRTLDTTQFKLADVHAARFDNLYGKRFDAGLTAVHGSADTINVSAAPFFVDGVPASMFVADDGSLYRMVVGFAADGTPEATLNFARGASEDPASPFFGDRQMDWADVRYTKLPFRRADVDAMTVENGRDTLVLSD